MSNPYAPPEDRPREPEGDPADAPVQDLQPPVHPPYPPPGWQQGAPGPLQRPVPGPVPTDPQGSARAGRIAGYFALVVLASVLVSFLRLPYSLLASVVAVAGMGLGVWALVVSARAHVRGALPITLVAGLVVAFLWSMAAALPALALRQALDRQTCLDGALTVSAQTACQADYEKALRAQRDSRSTRS